MNNDNNNNANDTNNNVNNSNNNGNKTKNNKYDHLPMTSKVNFEIINEILLKKSEKLLLRHLTNIFNQIGKITVIITDGMFQDPNNIKRFTKKNKKYGPKNKHEQDDEKEKKDDGKDDNKDKDGDDEDDDYDENDENGEVGRAIMRSLVGIKRFNVGEFLQKMQESFENKFCQYFAEMIHKNDIKPGISSWLTLFLLQTCIFWQVGDKSKKNRDELGLAGFDSGHETSKLGKKYSDIGLLDVCMLDDSGRSLYHIAAAYNDSEIFDILLKLDNDILKYKTSQTNETPLDWYVILL